MSEQSHKIS